MSNIRRTYLSGIHMHQTQTCPLCKNYAKFVSRDHGNRKHFWCTTCVEFHISKVAEDLLATSIPQWRSENSEKAKQSNQDKVWVITKSDAPRQENVGNEVLKGELVLRTELP